MKTYTVITGANGALGKALVKKYLLSNTNVLALDLNFNNLEDLKESPFLVTQEVNLLAERESLFHELTQKYPIDCWYNNAGVAQIEVFDKVDFQKHRDLVEINQVAVMEFTHLLMRYYSENKISGKIINVASMAGIIPVGGIASYVASKFALVGFGQSLQQEILAQNLDIYLLTVCPAFFKSPLMQPKTGRGLPQELNFLVNTPEKEASFIIRAIKKKESLIYTGALAKSMFGLNRLSQGLTKNLGIKLTKLGLSK